MNTQEHLNRIKAKCQELLAIWEGKRDHNIIYVASCGKQAEAGWKATIAAIEILPALDRIESSRLADEIIAAWLEELL
jgi:hypothetical protein